MIIDYFKKSVKPAKSVIFKKSLFEETNPILPAVGGFQVLARQGVIWPNLILKNVKTNPNEPNKANFNVKICKTKPIYTVFRPKTTILSKNKANSNPNKPNLKLK